MLKKICILELDFNQNHKSPFRIKNQNYFYGLKYLRREQLKMMELKIKQIELFIEQIDETIFS